MTEHTPWFSGGRVGGQLGRGTREGFRGDGDVDYFDLSVATRVYICAKLTYTDVFHYMSCASVKAV